MSGSDPRASRWGRFLASPAAPLVFSTLILISHLVRRGSYLHGLNYGWEGRELLAQLSLDGRHTVPAFAARPLTTWVAETLIRLGATAWLATVIVNYAGLLLEGYVLRRLLRSFGLRVEERGLAILLFYLSFSILYAYFEPISSWDEPLQYTFIFLALAHLIERPLRAGLWLCLACLARETTILILPGIALAIFYLTPDRSLRERAGMLARAVVLPAVFILADRALLPFPEPDRVAFHVAVNFGTLFLAVESIASAVNAFGLPALLAAVAAFHHRHLSARERAFLLAALVTALINTPIVFIYTRAQEARLFALPLVFLWPFAGIWLIEELGRWRPRTLRFVVCLIAAVACFGVLLHLAQRYYLPSGWGEYPAYRAYASLVLSLLFFRGLLAATRDRYDRAVPPL